MEDRARRTADPRVLMNIFFIQPRPGLHFKRSHTAASSRDGSSSPLSDTQWLVKNGVGWGEWARVAEEEKEDEVGRDEGARGSLGREGTGQRG